MTRWTPLLVLALALAGCGQGAGAAQTPAGQATSPPASPPAWTEPASYVYTVDSRCGERMLIGRIRLTVMAGKVTGAVGLDEPGQNLVSYTKLDSMPTLGDLLDEYQWARDHKADVARVTYDPVDGHPTRIELDPMRNGIDDEACYTVTDYAPA